MLQGSMEKNQYSIEIPPGRQGAILTVRSKYAIMSGRAELNRRPHGPEPRPKSGDFLLTADRTAFVFRVAMRSWVLAFPCVLNARYASNGSLQIGYLLSFLLMSHQPINRHLAHLFYHK